MVAIYNIILILILFLTIVYRFLNNSQYKKIFCLLFFLILGSLSAFRYEIIFSDFWRYTYHVIDAYKMSWTEIFAQGDFLNAFFQKSIIHLFHDPQYYFIFSGYFIVYAFLFVGYKFCDNICVFVFLFYTTFTYFVMHNITRQGIAAGWLCFSLYFLLINKKKLSLIFYFIAIFFHMSSFIFIIAYFFKYVSVNKKALVFYVLLLMSLLLLYPYFINIVQLFAYEDYNVNSFGMTPAKIYNIITIIPVLHAVLYLLSDRTNVSFSNYKGVFFQNKMNMLIHGSILYCIFVVLCCARAGIFMRVANIFVLFPMLCITEALNRVTNYRRLYFISVLYIIGIAIFIVSNINAKLFPSPYYFFWEVDNRPTLIR